MAFPATTNVDGSNPGPNSAVLPDTVQMPTGNLWKVGTFNLTSWAPGAMATGPSVNVKTLAATGIGLLTTDIVVVTYLGTQTAAIAIADSRVSALDQLETKFVCTAGTPTAAVGTVAAPYQVTVFRVQPNWTAPASGNQMDW